MRNQIIDQSITILRKDGLRFTVDGLCKSLNISKKTLYKEFKNKEELAKIVYFNIYEELILEANTLIIAEISDLEKLYQMINILKEAYYFRQDKLLNRYSLKTDIINYSNKSIDTLFCIFEKVIKFSEFNYLLKYNNFKYMLSGMIKEFLLNEVLKENYKEIINILIKNGDER